MKSRELACLVLVMGSFCNAGAASLPTYRFDMGGETSPVASGFLRVTPALQYSKRGYGWESTEQTAFDVSRPAEDPAWHQPAGQRVDQAFLIFKEHNDVTRDGVTSRSDLAFR